MFCNKGDLRNFAKFTGKLLGQSLSFNKAAGLKLWNAKKVFETLNWLFLQYLRNSLREMCPNTEFAGMSSKNINFLETFRSIKKKNAAWNMSACLYCQFLCSVFPVLRLNKEIYSINPRNQSNSRKVRTTKTANTVTTYARKISEIYRDTFLEPYSEPWAVKHVKRSFLRK